MIFKKKDEHTRARTYTHTHTHTHTLCDEVYSTVLCIMYHVSCIMYHAC